MQQSSSSCRVLPQNMHSAKGFRTARSLPSDLHNSAGSINRSFFGVAGCMSKSWCAILCSHYVSNISRLRKNKWLDQKWRRTRAQRRSVSIGRHREREREIERERGESLHGPIQERERERKRKEREREKPYNNYLFAFLPRVWWCGGTRRRETTH